MDVPDVVIKLVIAACLIGILSWMVSIAGSLEAISDNGFSVVIEKSDVRRNDD